MLRRVPLRTRMSVAAVIPMISIDLIQRETERMSHECLM